MVNQLGFIRWLSYMAAIVLDGKCLILLDIKYFWALKNGAGCHPRPAPQLIRHSREFLTYVLLNWKAGVVPGDLPGKVVGTQGCGEKRRLRWRQRWRWQHWRRRGWGGKWREVGWWGLHKIRSVQGGRRRRGRRRKRWEDDERWCLRRMWSGQALEGLAQAGLLLKLLLLDCGLDLAEVNLHLKHKKIGTCYL